MIQPIILSGGSGSRLWPLSRVAYPKQFLKLHSESHSMLQETLARIEGIPDVLDPIIICNENHRFIVAEQIRSVNKCVRSIILEPIGRNTAPATAIAAMQATLNGEDPLLLVLAADHVIDNPEVFKAAVSSAVHAAEMGGLVTFGIVPTGAETGYGYIKVAIDDLQYKESVGNESIYKVEHFCEKPHLSLAKEYFESGDYLWNSGMFLFKASAFLNELYKYEPDIFNICKATFDISNSDLDFFRLDFHMFEKCQENSIDYAVMERTSNAKVVPLNAGWSDIGSWSSLWDVSDKSADNNVTKGDVVLINSKNSYFHSSEGRLVAAVGVDNLIVIDTPDALLVAKKSCSQEVKELVGVLKNQGRSELDHHRLVYRPWGSYDAIDFGERYQVKRITVNAGAKLSVQMHHHRAEHWIVVSGTAKILRGKETFLLTENQSVYIPVGEIHALENPGKIPLELIEVQSGSYLGEDDIVRFEDKYGRV